MKDDEVYGATGTSYTAEFWQYDARVGRRWNLDPVDQVSISNYAAFGLNPIINVDPNGAWFWESKNVRQARHFARTTGGNFDKHRNMFTGKKDASVTLSSGSSEGINVNAFVFRHGQDRSDLLESADLALGGDTYDRMEASTTGFESLGWWLKSIDDEVKPGHTPPAALQAFISLNPVVAAGNVYSGLTGGTDVYGEQQSGLSIGLNAASLLPVGYMLKAAQGGRVFWTGGRFVGEEASAFAAANGLRTLNMTGTGRVLTAMDKVLPRNVMSPLWDAASWRMAWGAQGPVHLLYNAAPGGIRAGSTWLRIERPLLQGTNQIIGIPLLR
ncbi:MAG: hypothetical protein JSS84_01955 [Bacteroidetes bacterium]|nr:hypothetical protein [Bacteroidota bacterium]